MAKEKFRLGEQRVMSYGPCQTPTLWFCAQRHKEIQNFRPDKYYIVSLSANLYVRFFDLIIFLFRIVLNNVKRGFTATFMKSHNILATDLLC